MVHTASVAPEAWPGDKRQPLRLTFFCSMSLLDGFGVVFALGTILGIADRSNHTGQILGSGFTFDPPAFPWVVGVMSALSVAAAVLAMVGLRFAFVLGVALVWVVLGTAAIAAGSDQGLLIKGVLSTLLVFTSRSWFRT